MNRKDKILQDMVWESLEGGDMYEIRSRLKVAGHKPGRFNARFVRLESLNAVADAINAPHEDYPKRVPHTAELLNLAQEMRTFTYFEALQTHSAVMWDLPSRGRCRSVNVRVGSYVAPDHLEVLELLKKLFPVSCEIARSKWGGDVDYALKLWYEEFQMVHPFEDGNGRVGGIIVAALSYDGKTYMAPLQ